MDAVSRWLVEWLVNSAWQVALVALVASLADRLLGTAPARFRHLLWVAALVLSLAVPLASLVAGAGAGRQFRGSSSSALVGPQLPVAAPRGASALVEVTTPSGAVALAGQRSLSVWKSAVAGSLNRRSLALPLPAGLIRVIILAYLLSFLFNGTRLGLAWRRTRGVWKRARRRPLPDRLQSMLARCQASLGLARVSILFCDGAPGPFTLGVRRPVIVLPSGLLESASADDLAAALCHEMAHIRRRDYLWNLVFQAAYLVLAFHPAAALVRRRINQTRELACDETAAACLSASRYARSLVNLARSISAPAALEPGYILGVLDAGILEERVMRLLDNRPKSSTRAGCALLAGIVSLLTLCALAASLFTLRVSAASPYISQAAASGEAEGTISGTVFDPSGARVPDAVVTIRDQQGKQVKAAGTDQEGKFQVAPLPAGRYSLEVAKAGFAVYRRYVKVAGPASAESAGKKHVLEAEPGPLDIVLAPGQILESVVVTAKAGPNAPAAQRVGPKRIRVGGLVQTPKLVKMAKPAYPESAKNEGIEGTVLMQAVISVKGEPLSLRVLSSPDESLTKAAEDAVKQWRYEPTLLNGDPVEVATTIGVRFQLER